MIVSTLTSNISVVIKQAASYPTAGRYLKASSLNKGLAQAPYVLSHCDSTCEEIDSHTAQHYMRRIGLSQQELADVKDSWMSKELPALINPYKWIQGMDCITTALHWYACKAEIDSEFNKQGKEHGTDEYWNAVTELYDKVIEDTQPMYDVLHRAEIQKTTNELFKSAFMFKTQPMQNFGILFDAFCEAKATGSKESKIKVAKALSSKLTSLTIFATMSLIAAAILHKMYRYRDDDDDELTASSIARTVLTDMFIARVGLAIPIGGAAAMSGLSVMATVSVDIISYCTNPYLTDGQKFTLSGIDIGFAAAGMGVAALLSCINPLVGVSVALIITVASITTTTTLSNAWSNENEQKWCYNEIY